MNGFSVLFVTMKHINHKCIHFNEYRSDDLQDILICQTGVVDLQIPLQRNSTETYKSCTWEVRVLLHRLSKHNSVFHRNPHIVFIGSSVEIQNSNVCTLQYTVSVYSYLDD